MERSQRRFNTQVVIARQLKIANPDSAHAAQPGRFKKRHAMDCGRPRCGLCGNPRRAKTKARLTMQEVRQNAAARSDVATLVEDLSI